jgi:hypothetical protein
MSTLKPITSYFSAEEFQRIRRMAFEHEMSLSEYVKTCVLADDKELI